MAKPDRAAMKPAILEVRVDASRVDPSSPLGDSVTQRI